jgi:hypothetical protein
MNPFLKQLLLRMVRGNPASAQASPPHFPKEAVPMDEGIAIEYMDRTGNWIRLDNNIENKSQAINLAMRNLKLRVPAGSRIRAVGQDSGRLYDMLS